MPQLNLDCEGPLTLNDNAFELCEAFIPNGDKFFALISKYDDFLADVEKRSGYKAGDTLKLILPFLKAYDVTNDLMREFSKKTLKVLPEALPFLRFAKDTWPTFIISTSYRPYLEALSEVSGFPMENIFCTWVDLEQVKLLPEEKKLLQKLAQEIANLPMIEIPHEAQGLTDLPPESQKVILKLDEIFWKIIPETNAGYFLNEVNPIGGTEKAKAVKKSLSVTGLSLEEILYIGDSITDVQVFELVKEKGGAVSFNGNRYALRAAEFYALAPQAAFHSCLGIIFSEGGREALVQQASQKNFKICHKLPKSLKDWAKDFEFGLINQEDFEALVSKSESFRKNVRGEAVGALG
ncbi:hypothetical protein Thein_1564 [Thermodesulfatator indicus DSM 15286]|uniref:Uncharacterized protein n=1 Tax=Thermodesulfatator indicus (strain DSM 15286 / JCM 11887 / CIR29812) TaxID=667014 RepID=F8A9A2_THEID|nr:hypothetical protein [Thermodesulfatator indicus]AEH45425.1 hypothetical protein Thein_1564 [Thermodesulfatator indicus DSM 15286]